MECKNCRGETKNNNVYCSLSCRNIYVNKNMRDYSKCAKTINENSIKRYEENPNFCEKCDNKIEYEKRDNKFCSKECVDYNINRRGIKHTLSKEGLKSLRVSNKSRDYSKKKEYYYNYIIILFTTIFTLFFLDKSYTLEAELSVRIKDLVEVKGVRTNPLSGLGIVVGLQGTGDSKASIATNKAAALMINRLGITVTPQEVITKNIAVVIVTADLPPFARIGDKINIRISSH
jgi:hypothetical protein